MVKRKILIIKGDGSRELFDPIKLEDSLVRAGASLSEANIIVNRIHNNMNDGVTTSEIYRNAFALLKETSKHVAARYSLRRSLLELGPTGFPFEEYIAEIFKAKGYKTATDQMVLGTCVPHEVDVVAWNNERLIMAEIKYHNEPIGKTDLKVALYVKARYDDLKGTTFNYGDKNRKLDEGWLITNTKFTDTAIKYGECSGIKMLSWNYPRKGNLQDLIEETELHPLTCLTTLTGSDKKQLMSIGVVLCKTIYQDKKILKKLNFSEVKIFKVFEEIGNILRAKKEAML